MCIFCRVAREQRFRRSWRDDLVGDSWIPRAAHRRGAEISRAVRHAARSASRHRRPWPLLGWHRTPSRRQQSVKRLSILRSNLTDITIFIRVAGFQGELLKREWKILRDSLRQSMKKCRKGATTKAGAPCRKWRFHARMAFVLPYMTRRYGTTCVFISFALLPAYHPGMSLQ